MKYVSLLALAAFSLPAFAQTAAPAPAEAHIQTRAEVTRKVSADYANMCTKFGGTLSGPRAPRTLTGDFDKDGKPDYYFDPSNMHCSTTMTVFCGNAGCQVQIRLSSDNYAEPVTGLGGNATVVNGEPRLDVQRFNCPGAVLGDTCTANFHWDGTRLAFDYTLKKAAEKKER